MYFNDKCIIMGRGRGGRGEGVLVYFKMSGKSWFDAKLVYIKKHTKPKFI